MKLKLEQNHPVPVLAVSGRVSAEDSKVLKVGLTKLHSGSKKSLILDLTQSVLDSTAEDGILDIHLMALEKGIPLIVVGIKKRVCQTQTLKAALELVKKIGAEVPSLAILRTMFDHLVVSRDKFKRDLDGMNAEAELPVQEIRNEKLGALVQTLERHTQDLYRRFAEVPPSFRSVEERMAPLRWEIYKLLSEAEVMS